MKKFFMAVISIMMTVSVSAQFYIYLNNGDVLTADSISLVTPGALSGEFSVSATTTVQFSKGNLQYVGTWQFAEHQWDYFGESQYDNHRDLFGWGTGDAPNKVSEECIDYTTFTDWGTNPITNGGNKANVWRTLTKDEWVYLICDRENATTLFGFGTVNGVNGLILLPDNWQLPASAAFAASTTMGLNGGGTFFTNPSRDNYTHNTYSIEQWAVMEAAGAVFLPQGFNRAGETVPDNELLSTEYWSSNSDGEGNAYACSFDVQYFNPQGSHGVNCGFCVRLVR